MYNELTCLFGHHDYSDKETRDKYGFNVYLCKICKRSGYYKWSGATEIRIYCDFDERGNRIHTRWSNESATWSEYDEDGNLIGDDEWPREYKYWLNY